ncbi:MAG: vanadium-dependent haloperoxidase [Bacteroidota bacterium]
MRKLLFILWLFNFLLLISSCGPAKQPELRGDDISKVIAQMTNVMVHDVTNPPLAARFFAYTCLAGYEVVSQHDGHVKNMYGILNNYPAFNKAKATEGINYQLSAVLAMYKTAQQLQPSGVMLKKSEQQFLDSCRLIGFSEAVIDSSISYATAISKQILTYAKTDGYRKISSYPRYTPSGKAGNWTPTPPSYMAPVEPYFYTVRPLTLDSSFQFISVAPVPFSTEKSSAFYKFLLLNYAKGENGLTASEKDIANFWDCNPFAVQNDGHMVMGLKKISPGAHWLGITGIACKQSKAGFSKTVEVTTTVAIGLMDGFISCWADKYKTNRVRPETAIRSYIDPHWKPFLQTPPFPEYSSGHSVVSAASAAILTYYFGPYFKYTDSTEISYGIPPRKFNSFDQAAKEAAISRFLGGIHYKDAIDNGLVQGKNVGGWVLQKINKN